MSAIIVGGGITGLTAAYELARRGVPFVLLEASNRLGGLIRTEHIAGCTIECGADSLLVQKPAALDFCNELGLGERLMPTTPPRTAYVHARGRLFPIPSPSVLGIPVTDDALRRYDLLPAPARDTLRVLLESTSLPPAQDDESVAEFFRRRFGPDTVSLVAEPLLGGIHAGDIEQLSIRSVAPRLVAAAARSGSLGSILRAASSAPSSDGLFRSLPNGMAEIVDAVRARLPQSSIRLQVAPAAVTRAESGWTVALGAESIDADALVLAVPAHAAAALLQADAPEIAALCAPTPYVSTASVALQFARAAVAHPLDGSGFVVARRHSDLRITACSWVTSKWTGRAPSGTVLLRSFLGGAADPEAVALDDDRLVDAALRDLTRVLGISEAPLLARVHRWIRAGAQHNVGHLARMERLAAALATTPGLFVAGSGFHSIGVPDCIADGRSAGSAAADYVKMRA